MGEIRSAIDIAIEKTAGISSSKKSVDSRALKNTGKKAAGDFIGSGDESILEKLIASESDEKRALITEGAVSILLAGIQLPAAKADLEKLKRTGAGLEILLPKSGLIQLFGQVAQILNQYLEERDQLAKALEQQFMPRLRAKQQELAKRYGQTIPMELSQDTEYQAALAKNRRMLDQKYEAVIAEVRTRVREIAGIEE